MTVNQIRSKYLAFFERQGHTVIPSALLVPENDPTTLFTGSGMQPLLTCLLGAPHPEGRRLVDSQKCFRAEDIEEVGDNRHTTFFEMLGNWSLGDYFKREQLRWFFTFLTDEVGLEPERIYVTVFAGDEAANVPRDTESVEIWKKLFSERGIEAADIELLSEEEGGTRGMQGGRIFYYDAKKNWWSRAGVPENMPPGEPGGPDSEVFYDFQTEHDTRFGEHCHPNCDCGRFLEIGNSVFMEYLKQADGSFTSLPQKNVDFGGGLERIAAASQHNEDVYRVDALWVIIDAIGEQSKMHYEDPEYQKSFRIVADHLRGAVFMIGDGVLPSNTEQGYFVRRLLRRAIRHMDLLGMQPHTLHTLAPRVTEQYVSAYPLLGEKTEHIATTIAEEETRFRTTLQQGLKQFTKRTHAGISGKDAFILFSTYGFPLEMTLELAEEAGIDVDVEEFKAEFKKHQDASRAGAEKKFKGGLADHSAQSVRYHTATHLLHQALRDVLGEHVYQKGSNITPERLRFDFVHHHKMTDEEKQRVETLVNEKIDAALPVTYKIISLDAAKAEGAIGLFDDQYGDQVKVYSIGDTETGSRYSFEFCGGPHVENTAELGDGGQRFMIQKEEAVSAGVRRIRAVLREEG